MTDAFGRNYSNRQTADGTDIYDLTGGTGSTSGNTGSTSGEVIAYGVFSDGTLNSPADQLFNATVNKYSSTGSDAKSSTITVTDIGSTGKALAIGVGNAIASLQSSLGGQGGKILTSSDKSFQVITENSPPVTFLVISLPAD